MKNPNEAWMKQRSFRRLLRANTKNGISSTPVNIETAMSVRNARFARLGSGNDNETINEGISICLTAWKTADYIEECLDSIENQTWFKTHDNFEVLLGIDACEETLAKVKTIMHKYRNLSVYMMDKNVGTYVTTNTMMSLAQYEWLLRFDTDDIMPNDMIENIFVNNLKNIDVIRIKFHNFGINNQVGLGYGVHMVKQEVFKRFGGYRNWRIAGDYDFIYRIEPFTKILILNNIFYKRRYRLNGLQYSPETNMKSKKRLELHEFIKNKSRNEATIRIETTSYNKIYSSIETSNYNKVCFIIPNRDGQHLNDVIKNINTIYNDYNKEIVIINQVDNDLFKRGQIFNIGLKECNCEWVALCDNDIIHFNKINLFKEYEINGNQPYLGFKYITQVRINGDRIIKGEKKINTSGAGAFLFGKKEDFVKVNGFSNLYLGWGCEDNEISCRLCNNNNIRPTLKHLNQELGHITHPKRNNSIIYKRNREILVKRTTRNIQDDGLNQTNYNIISKQCINNVTYIDVTNIGVCNDFKYKNLLK